MKKWEVEQNLKLFVLHVERGKTPPPKLMAFMAEGAQEFLKGGKPWQVKTGRKSHGSDWAEHSLSVKAYVLDLIGTTRARISLLLGISEKDQRTLRRYIKHGKECCNLKNTGRYSMQFAIDDLLIELELKPQEKKALQDILDKFKKEDDEYLNEPEPNYD